MVYLKSKKKHNWKDHNYILYIPISFILEVAGMLQVGQLIEKLRTSSRDTLEELSSTTFSLLSVSLEL